ncbi:DUF1491 family protein [Martelella sp. HB161492]|uniref:DUF1491 family protein n=1 Tax=Martelella sp. HB161492 TaxID=2720726 RepID=UPI0015929C71|nr:DUF1491 family protein [Martelella sp. HB161492]
MSARLRSDIFVSALCRQVFAKGGFAAVERKGAEAAGAIAIRQTKRDGRETLFMPAPQVLADEDGARVFEMRLEDVDVLTLADKLEKERRFDSDLWIVALEIDDVSGLFAVAA